MQDWNRSAASRHLPFILISALVFLVLTIVGCGGNSAIVTTQSGISLAMSQATVQFGNVPVGSTTQPQTLIFTNPVGSSSSVTISNLTITGAGFSLVQTPTLPIIVAAGQSASIQVQASASAGGALTGTITITSTATPATSTVNLLATGVSGPSQSISGTISPAAQAVGATVTSIDANGKSDTANVDSNGNYQLFIFATGSATITPSASGLFFTPSSQTITVNVGNAPQTNVNFTVSANAPVPAITSLVPSTLLAGSGAQTLTINGTNFLSTSTVTYNGVAHQATFVTGGQLTIQLSAADLAVAGSFAVIVTSPAPGGGASTPANLTVNNPVPAITSLSPASLTAGSAAQTLTINGSGFVAASTATYNGSAHAATFVNNGKLTIQLSAADLAAAGNFAVAVTNATPGGGSSPAVNLIVNSNPVPAITSLSPASLTAGSAAQTLTINGSNFVSASTVTYNGVAHVATFVNSSQLTIQLSAADLATAGSFAVVVTNPAPGGGSSPAANLIVNNPVPAITSLSPASLTVGSAAQTLAVNGSGFVPASTVTYNAVAHAATFVNTGKLTIQLSVADLAAIGNFAVIVTNATPGGGSSTAVNLVVNNPVPAITSLSPTSLSPGSAAQALTINGSNFLSASTVAYNGVAHVATFVNSSQLTIQLSTADLATAGNFGVVVTNPAPGGGASSAVNFIVGNPAPVIASLSPASLSTGSAAQTLTINGSNFLSASTVTYNAVAHAATFVSAAQLTIQLSAPDLATAGSFAVIVTNPGGGASNSVNISVNNPVPAISSLSPASLAIGTTGPQTLTINGSNFVAASTVTYNGVSHATTLVNGSQLTIQLSTADLATAGTFPVVATNPAPGGGVSLAANFVLVGLSVTPGSLTFGSIDDGTSSAGQNGTLMAVGGSVTVNAPTVTGAGFSVTGVTFPLTLTAGQSTPFTVTFSPASGSPGAVAGNAQFTSTVNTVAQTLSGTGARNVLLTWGASSTSGVTYNVYRCTGSCASPLTGFTQIKTGVNALTYTDDDPALVSGTTYFYAITAALTGVESDPSNVASATVP
jgi:hypothetical protein